MRNFIHVLISIAVVASAQAAFGQTGDKCAAIPNRAVGLGDVYDQEDTSWCHSFTAADLLTQKLQRMKILKPGERIHPLAVAAVLQMRYQTAPDFGTRFGGTAFENLDALEYASSKLGVKLCKQNEFGSLGYSENQIARKARSEAMRAFRGTLTVPLIPDENPKVCADSNEYTEIESIVQTIDSDEWKKALNERCSVKMPKLEHVSLTSAQWSADIKDKDNIRANPEREQTIGKAIDDALESGSIAGIDYRPNFMLADAYKIKSTHWSSIIGRRTGPDGRCQYLLRNSWGKDCTPVADRASCIAGQIWVSREQLLRATDAVQYIK